MTNEYILAAYVPALLLACFTPFFLWKVTIRLWKYNLPAALTSVAGVSAAIGTLLSVAFFGPQTRIPEWKYWWPDYMTVSQTPLAIVLLYMGAWCGTLCFSLAGALSIQNHWPLQKAFKLAFVLWLGCWLVYFISASIFRHWG